MRISKLFLLALAASSVAMSVGTLHVSSVNRPITPGILVAEGDSITFPDAHGYADITWTGITNSTKPAYTNLAVSGSFFSTLTNRAAAADLYRTNNRVNCITVLIGVNDIGGMSDASVTNYYNNLKGYFLDRRAVGWKTIICTVLPRTNANFSAPRATLNTLIKSSQAWYDAVADFGSDATMGPDAAALDLTLYKDGVHPTNLGQTNLASIYSNAVFSINGLIK